MVSRLALRAVSDSCRRAICAIVGQQFVSDIEPAPRPAIRHRVYLVVASAPRQGDNMNAPFIITLVLIAIAIAMLPMWKYSRHWGGGYKMSAIAGLMLGVHIFTVYF